MKGQQPLYHNVNFCQHKDTEKLKKKTKQNKTKLWSLPIISFSRDGSGFQVLTSVLLVKKLQNCITEPEFLPCQSLNYYFPAPST